METNSVTDYLQSLRDIEAAISNGSITYDVIMLNNEFLQKFRPLAWR